MNLELFKLTFLMNIYFLEGLLIGLTFYNFFLYYLVKEKAYLYYSVTLISFCVYFPCLDTNIKVPNEYWFFGKYTDPLGFVVSLAVIGIWGGFWKLCDELFEVKKKYPFFNKIFLGVFLGMFGILIFHYFIQHLILDVLFHIYFPVVVCNIFPSITDLMLVIGLLGVLYINFKEYQQKNPIAFYFFWANIFVIAGGLFFIFSTSINRYIIRSSLTDDIAMPVFQASICMQVILFAVALADRINILRKVITEEKLDKAFVALQKNQEIQEILEKQNQKLDEKVQERTYELQEKNQELEVLSEELQSSLEQREWLLKEMHHRVKNNLQIISSILRLQSRKIQDTQALNIIKDGQSRVQSIALIHQKLYQSDNIVKVDCKEYIIDLVKYLENAYFSKQRKINMHIEAQKNIYLDVEKVVALGLIINELVSNAFKYAFLAKNEGNIWINFLQKNEQMTLEVQDDGKGFDAEIDLENSKTLGLDLVYTLTQQLKGKLNLINQNGVKFTLEF